MKCFQDIEMTNNDMVRMLYAIEPKFVAASSILFEIGDRSDCFYIMLSGKCDLYLPNPEIGAMRNKRKSIESEIDVVNKNISIIEAERVQNPTFLQDEYDKLRAKRQQLAEEAGKVTEAMGDLDEMIPRLTYTRRQSFGELSLLRGDPRAGTVVTKSDCHFAVVGAASYEKLIKKSEQIKIAGIVKFLR